MCTTCSTSRMVICTLYNLNWNYYRYMYLFPFFYYLYYTYPGTIDSIHTCAHTYMYVYLSTYMGAPIYIYSLPFHSRFQITITLDCLKARLSIVVPFSTAKCHLLYKSGICFTQASFVVPFFAVVCCLPKT